MGPPPDPTDKGGSHTPTADSERRRSSRLASRFNPQDTNESSPGNTHNMSNSKSKPKIILHFSPKSTDKAHGGNPAQATEHTNASMVESSGERPRKARRVNSNTAPRRASDIAAPLQGPGFEPGVAPSGAGLNASQSTHPVAGHGDRSGNSGSHMVTGPSSGQQKRSAGRKVSNTKTGTAASMGHRVPGMPSTMPRSDTTPPQFDVTNPYSAFATHPAPVQRRPPTPSVPTGFPGTTPSSPSGVVPTATLRGSGRDQTRHATAQLDHRDPSWRHPWGVPVEPLPPALPRYVPPQERANIIENLDNGHREEFHGLDEHIPLGDHHLDIAFANSLIENQQRENVSAGNLNALRMSDNSIGLGNDLAAFDEQALAPGPQTGVLNAQALQVAGDMTAFPNYPYGFDQVTLNPTSLRIQNRPPALSALMHLTDNAQALANNGGDDQDVRRSSLAASIMDNLVSERAKADMSKRKENGKGKERALASQQNQQSRQPQQPQQTQRGQGNQSNSKPPRPGLKDLALAKLKVGKVSPAGEPTCTFCRYECDWGISNSNFCLDEEASTGWCQECSNPNTGSFFEEFTSILESRDDEASRAALEKMNEPVQSEAIPHHGPRVYSSIDGNEITKFMGPMFCKTCPWDQVDIGKVRICSNHRNEKFAIVKHRHQVFRQIGYAMPDDLLSADKIPGMNMNDAEDRVRADVIKTREINASYSKNKRCMMCTGLATDVCVGCPLLLCSTCSTILKNICKGYLDNLFYYYERHHIRNDAFLLRSDGGGF